MRIVIAGGHGQIARRLGRLLAAAGHEPVGLIRNPAHAADLEADGSTAVLLDLEQVSAAQVAEHLAGADAVVFAAGGGPGSGAARKETVDKGAAILLAEAAEAAGVRRYLMVSAIGVEGADPTSEDVFQIYLRAKADADADLRARDLDWTVVRPGGLTDQRGTGLIAVGDLGRGGQVTRDDVAAVLVACLKQPVTIGTTFDLLNGDTPIDAALAKL